MNWKAKFRAVSDFINNPLCNRFLAKEQLVILQREISAEAALWFGATWDTNKEEYLSDKGNSEIIQRTTKLDLDIIS